MSADNRDLAKRIALGVVVGLGGAAGLYYLLKKCRQSPGTSGQKASSVEGKTVEQLKVLGNKAFSEKKYHEAVEMFTRAIELEEEGSEGTKAMCFQNRGASKERASGYTADDCLADYAAALEMNPAYGKAYFRRGVLMQKESRFRESLIELFCATHIDSNLEKNANSLIPLVVEEIEKLHHEEYNKTHKTGTIKHVRHERVYAWMNKTVVNDPLKRLAQTKNLSDGNFAEAVKLLQNQKYDEVASCAAAENEEKYKLEAFLLSAKFFAYENRLDEARRQLNEFDVQYDSLIELEKEAKKGLIAAKHIIEIEIAPNKSDLLARFYEAVATDIRNIDFYIMAAFRLVIYNEAHEAMKLLSTESLEENNNIKLLRLTLSILANTDGQQDAARLHTAIMDLDTFVRSMENPTCYAKTLLAKVYSTFSQSDPAQELMDEVMQAEPKQSVHLFDRSCMSNSAEEAMDYLKQCLELEPYHAEANLMYASLRLNEIGNSIVKNLISRDAYNEMSEYLDRAEATFDGAPDFPVVSGVFRMRELLDAKLAAAERLGLLDE